LAHTFSSWIFLVVAILAAVALYARVFWYQAERPNRESVQQTWPDANAPCLVAGANYTVELTLAYPHHLLNEPSAASQPLSAWLQASTTSSPSQRVEAWIIAFSPHDQGVKFTDQAGSVIAPRIVITPGIESTVPGVLYVRQSALASAPNAISLTMRVYENSYLLNNWWVGQAADHEAPSASSSARASIRLAKGGIWCAWETRS